MEIAAQKSGHAKCATARYWKIAKLAALAVLLPAVLMTVSAGPAAAERITGRVVSVVDGDTLVLLTPSKVQIRVRLSEIDAPEGKQPWGRRAKQMLSGLVLSRTVSIEIRGKDQYGRTLGKVYAGGTYVNAEMVRSGAAWAYREYLTDYSLISLESAARKAKEGLWAMPEGQTVAPWEWRHNPQSQQFVGPPTRTMAAECGFKRYCRQMSSCEEAYHYLQYCGVSSLDGDGDGRPCEVMCRRQ